MDVYIARRLSLSLAEKISLETRPRRVLSCVLYGRLALADRDLRVF